MNDHRSNRVCRKCGAHDPPDPKIHILRKDQTFDAKQLSRMLGYPWRSLRPIISEHGIGYRLNGRWRFDNQDLQTIKEILRVKSCHSKSIVAHRGSTELEVRTTESVLTEALKLADEKRQKR